MTRKLLHEKRSIPPQKIKSKQINPVLSDPDVKKHLEELNRKFVIPTIDKASNNFAFICRKYYISKLLVETSPNKNRGSTYSHKHKSLRKKLLKVTSNIAKMLTLN